MVRKMNATERGHIAEMRFKLEAAQRGLKICEPILEAYPYDNVLDNGNTFWRAQVKLTSHQRSKDVFVANCKCTGKERAYRRSEIDFGAVYLCQAEAWYIIPVDTVERSRMLLLYGPSRRDCGPFAAYYEAWGLLKARRPCGICLQASADTGLGEMAEVPNIGSCNGSLLESLPWGGLNLNERNLRVTHGDDPDGLGIVLEAVAAWEGE